MNLDSAETVHSDLEIQQDKHTGRKTTHKRIGRYTLTRELGRGAFATVYKALDSHGSKFAIKQIAKARLTPKQYKALKEEVRVMHAMENENSIKMYGVMQSQKNYYLVTEYCSGGDLDRLRGKQLKECTVQMIIHQLSKALKILVDHNIMHRDLKLNNLLLSSKGAGAVVKLADFGLARQLRGAEYAKTFCGTPLYMAPEVLAGEEYDLKADLWSIGVLLYLFLTGHFPFQAATPHKLLVELNHAIVKFPHDVQISDCCLQLMKRLLQVDPEKRIDWKEYFEHPFVKSAPEAYQKAFAELPKGPAATPQIDPPAVKPAEEAKLPLPELCCFPKDPRSNSRPETTCV